MIIMYYIGSFSLILPGVTIENNVLIGAGSVVTKSIPSSCVVGGNPARILCDLDKFEKNIYDKVGMLKVCVIYYYFFSKY